MRFELFGVFLLIAFNTNANETDAARKRWAESPHGPFLERILPPGFEAIMLPDPGRYTAAQWPAVVARMQKNMEWMNRVVGSKPVPGELQLKIEDINAFLVRHARK